MRAVSLGDIPLLAPDLRARASTFEWGRTPAVVAMDGYSISQVAELDRGLAK
jgi:hypothetical protein